MSIGMMLRDQQNQGLLKRRLRDYRSFLQLEERKLGVNPREVEGLKEHNPRSSYS